MRIAFILLVIIHALIHLIGFVKGVGWREVKELSLHISRPMAVLWLLAALFLIVYAVSFSFHGSYTWLIGMMAVLISQVLIMLYWKDARFGTLPNVIILLVAVVQWGHFSFRQLTQRETEVMLAKVSVTSPVILSEQDVKHLPETVVRWLQASGAIGHPVIKVGKVWQSASMQLKPEQDNWLEAQAVQYTTTVHPAFIWTVDVKMNSLLGFTGRDKFENGKGGMLIKLNSLISIVDEQGEKLNEGALQRYLGEMVWFPSLAISPYITWEPLTDSTAKATMTVNGTTGSGIFHFNQLGEVTRFTAMRFKGNDPAAKRYEWMMQILDYKTFDGIKVPSTLTSTWKLEEGDWTWLKLKVSDLKYNAQALQ